jgi:hypothetical protein
MGITLATDVKGNLDEQDYHEYIQRMNKRFRLESKGQALFRPIIKDLFDTFLDNVPQEDRQYHTCSCCRNFVNRFGDVVTIDEVGRPVSAMWDLDDTPEYYKPAVSAMLRRIESQRVKTPFLSSELTWGSPVTGVWRHMSIVPDKEHIYKRSTMTAGQKMAELREDFKTMITALGEFNEPMLEQAVKLLKTDSLYRSEKVLGAAEWLLKLRRDYDATVRYRPNILWKAVATAPAGFCHPRSSMIGTLLEDIAAGMNYNDIERRFKAKMSPLVYQRPQAAPKAGTIAQAEKVVEQMGIANSLKRRYALVEELNCIWIKKKTAQAKKDGNGVFGHLAPREAVQVKDMLLPAITVTWDKFQRTVLPGAERIQCYIHNSRSNYGAFTTAVDGDAPPILAWDQEDQRNPFSTYLWVGGSLPSQWSLPGGFVDVTAVAYRPNMWFGNYPNQTQGVMFVLNGAKESRSAGLALFPEILKSELHSVRSVIEAFSNRGEIEGMDEATACGLMLDKGQTTNHLFRVTINGQKVDYKIDRWD